LSSDTVYGHVSFTQPRVETNAYSPPFSTHLPFSARGVFRPWLAPPPLAAPDEKKEKRAIQITVAPVRFV
jgi:hypothetical protein